MIDLTDYKAACKDLNDAAQSAIPAFQGLMPALEMAHEALLEWIGPMPDPSPAAPIPAPATWVVRDH
jgi:hypothetical protein